MLRFSGVVLLLLLVSTPARALDPDDYSGPAQCRPIATQFAKAIADLANARSERERALLKQRVKRLHTELGECEIKYR